MGLSTDIRVLLLEERNRTELEGNNVLKKKYSPEAVRLA